MRFFTFLLFSLFLMTQATPAMASLESVPANGSTSSYASYVEGIKHNKKNFKKARLFKKADRKKATGKETDNDGIVAAILAFFLGGLGIHRVYLGSDGIIVLWYVISIFGIFGIIPLVDFIRLLINGSAHYRGNNSLIRCFQSE